MVWRPVRAAYGLKDAEKHYKPEVLEAADKQYRGIGIQQLLMICAQQNGYSGRPWLRSDNLREVMNAFPSASGVLRDALSEHLDVGQMVQEKVRQLDLDALEALVFRVARQEFRYIELLGGLIGFVVGLVQVLVMRLV